MSTVSVIDKVKEQETEIEIEIGDDQNLLICVENPILSSSTQQEEQQEQLMIKTKYGGILPKKKPLISMDHEHAFFDSADWALGKQGAQKPKGPAEALRPKLQPTPHQQLRSRRSAYAPADECDSDCDVDGGNHQASSEDKNSILDDNNTHTAAQNQILEDKSQ